MHVAIPSDRYRLFRGRHGLVEIVALASMSELVKESNTELIEILGPGGILVQSQGVGLSDPSDGFVDVKDSSIKAKASAEILG
jgi:hypothetical protein